MPQHGLSSYYCSAGYKHFFFARKRSPRTHFTESQWNSHAEGAAPCGAVYTLTPCRPWLACWRHPSFVTPSGVPSSSEPHWAENNGAVLAFSPHPFPASCLIPNYRPSHAQSSLNFNERWFSLRRVCPVTAKRRQRRGDPKRRADDRTTESQRIFFPRSLFIPFPLSSSHMEQVKRSFTKKTSRNTVL